MCPVGAHSAGRAANFSLTFLTFGVMFTVQYGWLGFFPRCGSFLFWTAHDEDTISFALGALDAPTGLTLEKHIFCEDKGDYYDIEDDLPHLARS